MRPRYSVIGVATVVVMLTGCAVHEGKSQWAVPQTEHEVAEPVVMTYTPSDWPEALEARVRQPVGQGPFPAVLIVHGGGWQRRGPDDMTGIAEDLAASGLVTVNVAHRFGPGYQFPAQPRDLQQAMRWIHANAGRFNIDADRIGALGYSSGAHLVSLLALVAEQGGELDGGPRTRPAAVVAGGTPSDLRKWQDGKLIEDFLGGTQAEVPDAYRLASPVVHVHPEAPPFFLFHGTMDKLVPADHATDFYAALQDAGVVSELYRQRFRGHALAFVLRGGAMTEAKRFLHQHLGGHLSK